MIRLTKMNNQNGSIYLECLLSFFIWVIILNILLPCFMKLTVSRKDLLLENEAHKVVSNQYMKLIADIPVDQTIDGKFGVTYEIKYQEREGNAQSICVNYAQINNLEKEICRTIFKK